MSLTRINNQAVKLYTPSETLHNERGNTCQWHLDYWPLATCDDTSDIVLDTSLLTADLETDGDFSEVLTGTNTGTGPSRLIDGGASFLSTVTVGQTVRNITTDASATVNNIDSNIQLTLSADIFPSTPTDYSIQWYELTGNMSLGVNELIMEAGGASTCTQANLPLPNLLYKMSIDITSFSSTTPGDQIRFKIGGLTVLTIDETSENTTGTFVMSGFNTVAITETEIQIDCDAGIEATFTNLEVDQYSSGVYFIVNCEDDTVVYGGALEDVATSPNNDQIMLSVDWSQVADGYTCQGCYYVVVVEDLLQPDDLIGEKVTNGTFDTDTDWTKGTGWTISGGRANMSVAGAAGELTQTFTKGSILSEGACYEITIDALLGFSGSFDVQLIIGAFSVVLGTISANGSYTYSTGILNANGTGIKLVPSSGAQVYSVDNISIMLDLECTGETFRTDCYQLASSHDCTVKLSGTNNDNAFGIDFEGLGYNPFVRVVGELEAPKYEGDKEDEEDSAGVSRTLYFKSEKTRNLFIHLQPDFIHDFVRLLIGYDTFQVDDVTYVSKDASYSVESDRLAAKRPDLANANTEVRLGTDLNENKFC